MFGAFFHDGVNARRRLKVFYLVFGAYVILLVLLIGGLVQNHQDLYLGTLSRMDISPSHRLVDHLPCCTDQCNGLSSVRWQ